MIRLSPQRLAWICLGLLALAGCAALIFMGGWRMGGQGAARPASTTRLAQREAQPPLPAALETRLMPVSPLEAKAINARMAFSTAPIEPARPFILPPLAPEEAAVQPGSTGLRRDRAVECLTAAIYYEAASESDQGQRAVAQVVLNRMRHPAFPKSICGVVYQGSERTTGCQFTFTCDGALARRPSELGWQRARRIALAALDGAVEPSVGMATHYHTDWVVPYWAPSLDKVAVLGAHIFYRWQGYWGRRVVFRGSYVGEAGVTIPLSAIPTSDSLTEDGLTEPPQGSGLLADGRIRPLADQIAHVLPARNAATQATPAAPVAKLRADEGRGTLAADLNPVLLDAAPRRVGN